MGWIGQQLIAFFFCVLFPGFVTAVAPVSWVKLTRADGRVSAVAHTCVFFVIPYSTQRLDQVVSVGDRRVAGEWSRERSTRKRHRSEDQGFLQLNGPDETIEVSVSPVNVKDIRERVEAFLGDAGRPELRFWTVANWKFSVIFGGLTSLLTVLYVIGIVGSILVGLYRFVAPPREAFARDRAE
ncbi:MAG: hypothetical protein U0795_17790 [Pirellulales bacterium]